MLYDFEKKDWFFLIIDFVALGATLWGLLGGIYVLGGLGGVGFLVALWFSFNHFKHKSYPYSILCNHIVVDFKTDDANLAHYTQEQRLRPNRTDLSVYFDPVTWAEGTVRNHEAHIFEIDPKTQVAIREIPSTIHPLKLRGYRHVFDEPLKKGGLYKRVFVAELVNSFPDHYEGYTFSPIAPQRDVRLTILFHPGKPPGSIEVFKVLPHAELMVPCEQPVRLPQGGSRFTFTCNRIAPRQTYRIGWAW